MTHQLAEKLRAFADQAETSLAAAANALAPKLREAAEDAEHKLEAWTTAVDHWVEVHFTAAAGGAREEAGAAYRLAVTKAHELLDEVKAHL